MVRALLGDLGMTGRPEAEAELAAVMAAAQDAVLTVSLDGRIHGSSPSAERLYGYTASELLGVRIERLVSPTDGADLQDRLRQLERGVEVPRYRTMHRRRSGELIPVSVSLGAIRRSGALVGLAYVVQDLAEQTSAEDRFRLALEAAPSGMVLCAPDGSISLLNAAAAGIFGYPKDELLGRPVEMLVPTRVRTVHSLHRARMAGGGASQSMTRAGRAVAGRRKDGTEVLVEVALFPIPVGERLMTLASVVDVTERSRAEEAMRAQHLELEQSNAALAEFAYVASHDLQEPLRMIASFTELLASRYRGQLDERADQYIHYAVDGAKRMQCLISDLLAYSRVGAPLKSPVRVDTRAVMRAVLLDLQAAKEECAAQIALGELPMVRGDEVRLHQLFLNVLGNALKFRGERPPRISVGAERRGQEWVFHIQDNGIGIDPRYAEKVFHMFQRLHDRGRYEGNGIGLAIAKRIVEALGGQMWFESTLGAGTTFFFTLPGLEDERAAE